MSWSSRTDMAASAFCHSAFMGPFCTRSPVWMTILPFSAAQLSTIHWVIFPYTAGFVSERNWVSVIQNIEKGAADLAGCEGVTTGGRVRVRVWTGGSIVVDNDDDDDDDVVFVWETVMPGVDPSSLDCVLASVSSSPLGRRAEVPPMAMPTSPTAARVPPSLRRRRLESFLGLFRDEDGMTRGQGRF